MGTYKLILTMKLTYFGLYGRAEAARMALAHAKVEFTDVRLTFPEWGPIKAAKGPSYQLPMFEHDGTEMAQSVPILRYIGMLHGYFPMDDPKLCHAADATIENNADIMKDAPMMVFFGDAPASDEQLKKMDELCNKYYAHLEAQLEDGRKYLCGARITTADFKIFASVMSVATNVSAERNEKHHPIYAVAGEALAKYAKLSAWCGNMEAELAEYLAARPGAKI